MAARRIPVLALLALGIAAAPASSSHGGVRDKSPSWSPDGALIAFSKSGNDFDEIWVARTDGTGHRRLTAAGARDTQPAWSPDGRRIAFASFAAGNWDVYVMDADGGNRRRVTAGATDETAPAWSPDGSLLAYQRFDATRTTSEIHVVAADGSSDRLLAAGARSESPAWSPDGGRIVFQSTRDGNWELYAMDADGSGVPRRLTATPDRREDNPAWSPDGTRIAFAAGDDVRRDIYLVAADGSGEQRVTHLAKPVWWPRWSPDSSRLAFFEFPFPAATIRLVNADGTGLMPLFGRLRLASVSAVPKRPVAGRPFALVLRVTGEAGGASVTCRASLGGRRLRPAQATFAAGRATCRWSLPRTSTGKRLAGSVVVVERGARIARAFSYRVGK